MSHNKARIDKFTQKRWMLSYKHVPVAINMTSWSDYTHTSSTSASFSSFINNLPVNKFIFSTKLAFSCKIPVVWRLVLFLQVSIYRYLQSQSTKYRKVIYTLNITRNVGQCPTWWSPGQTQVAPSVQRCKVWLTPTTWLPCGVQQHCQDAIPVEIW